MENKIIKLTPVYSKSRVDIDWKCPRKRYWNYEYKGKGVEAAGFGLELGIGIAIHDSFAAIAMLTQAGKPVDIDDLGNKAYEQIYTLLYEQGMPDDAMNFAKEQGTLVEGLVRGFYKHAWPRLLARYPNIIMVEGESFYNHDDLAFFAKPDLILGSDDGEVCYIEYKSTSSKKDTWVNSWNTAVQLHSSIRAVAQTHGITCDSVVVQGLYKGYESYGKQSSPFCYAYRRTATPPFVREDVAYDYKPGYRRTPTWELEGGVKKWVEEMPDVILGDQFPQTAPIMIKDDLIDGFFRQRAIREHEINDAKRLIRLAEQAGRDDRVQSYMDGAFPQRFDQCVPSFGRSCPYLRLCHGAPIDPIDAGFTWRTPHLEAERLYVESLENEE